MNYPKLPLEFYRRNTKIVARQLIGKILHHRTAGILTSGIVIETEAYLGIKDHACHTFGGRKTKRVESMYKMGGHSYVYLIYGLHSCFNVVTQNELQPEAVLIRALVPCRGIETMEKRRGSKKHTPLMLCSGPGKLCQAMGIDRSDDSLLLDGNKIWITEGIKYNFLVRHIIAGPRVGIDYAKEAKDWPLRFSVPATTSSLKKFLAEF